MGLNFFFQITQVVGDVAKMGLEECLSLGYNTPNLMCSDCDNLGRFSLSSLSATCQSCCTEDGTKLDEKIKYSKAILEVCG